MPFSWRDPWADSTRRVPASFPLLSRSNPLLSSFPTRDDLGDFASGQLLREAARLSTRAAAGPFRSFGRIAAEPRPYQLVPLMMALKLDPVRLSDRRRRGHRQDHRGCDASPANFWTVARFGGLPYCARLIWPNNGSVSWPRNSTSMPNWS